MREKILFSVLLVCVIISNVSAISSKQKPYLMHCPSDSNDYDVNVFSKEYARGIISEMSELRDADNNEVRLMDSEDINIIDVNSDITTNQIWTANNVYHITSEVDVQALLVIEPGTIVMFSVDGYLDVNDGGTLISKGIPEYPIVYTTDGSLDFSTYFCAIYIDQTASPATTITYSIIEAGYAGLIINNNRLDHPIENNYFYYNLYSIAEVGTKLTDLRNNAIFNSFYYNIIINMKSEFGDADANTIVYITNNTCDYCLNDGIILRGVDDENDAGTIWLINNLISECFNGIGISIDSWMNLAIVNTGYSMNYQNKGDDYPEYNPVIDDNMPYKLGPEFFSYCYLDPNCGFIDAGYEYIEETTLVGTTTNPNGMPDNNIVDIGYHYPNWNYSNAGATTLQADFDNSYCVDYNDLLYLLDFWLYDYDEDYEVWYWDFDDSGKVDFLDLAYLLDYWPDYFNFVDFSDFAKQWQREVDARYYDEKPDLNGDDVVNFMDFAILAGEWGKTGTAEPNIQIDISGDGSDGYVEVGISNYSQETCQAFLFVDGQYSDNLFGFDDGRQVLVNVAALGDGSHQFKVVGMDSNNNIICSHLKKAEFNEPLSYCLCNEAYEVNKPLYFCAYSDKDVNITALDEDENVLWTQTYSAENVNGSVPAEITRDYFIDQIIFEKIPAESEMQLFDSSSEANVSVTVSVTPSFDTANIKSNVRALMVFPDKNVNKTSLNLLLQVRVAFNAHHIECYPLKEGQATAANLAWFAQNRDIEYLYYHGHGGFSDKSEGGTLRTLIVLADGPVFSFKQSDFDPNNIPVWCEKLNGNSETTGSSIYSMGFNTLKFVHLDCCWSSHLMFNVSNTALIEGPDDLTGLTLNYPNDMAIAFGLIDDGQYYQGWYPDIFNAPSTYAQFSRNEWHRLCLGYTLYWALFYAMDEDIYPDTRGRYASEDLKIFGSDFTSFYWFDLY